MAGQAACMAEVRGAESSKQEQRIVLGLYVLVLPRRYVCSRLAVKPASSRLGRQKGKAAAECFIWIIHLCTGRVEAHG